MILENYNKATRQMLKEHIDKQICSDVLLCLWENEPQCKLQFDYLTEKSRTKDANRYSELQMTFEGKKYNRIIF